MAHSCGAIAWIIALALLPGFAVGQELSNNAFNIQYGAEGITSLRRANDIHETEYVSKGGVLGNVVIQYRKGTEHGWTTVRGIGTGSAAAPGSNTINYLIGTLVPTLPQPGAASASVMKEIKAEESFKLSGDYLDWTLTIANLTAQPIEIGDLALPMSMAEGIPADRRQIYTRKLIRHSFIAGNGSWVFWQRANAEGPFLVMLPQGDTKIEYTETVAAAGSTGSTGRTGGSRGGGFTPFIHAAMSSIGPLAAGKKAGREQPWRLPLTSLKLAPMGSQGDSVSYSFRFTWAKDFNAVREVLYNEGSIDVNIVPGMALPTDLTALISLRTKHKIDSVVAEFPASTKVEFVGDKGNGHQIYKVSFSKLGENMLTIRYGGGKWSTLQFFITEPLETVIKKRSSFLVNSMQHKDPSQWWYGVYSDWDQVNKILRSPIDRDGLPAWLTDASDDAGNARPAYVASKNLFFPVQAEIDSVELYIKHYLFNGNRWDQGTGGMQMTEKEPYPYGIYGTFDNWYQHRTIDPTPPANFRPQTSSLPLDVGWTRLHREHLWRIYDYPHIMLMYFRMYQIGKMYPTMVHYANAEQYLMLAYNTSVAYWTVPMQTNKPHGWSANSVPTMNEAFLPELISALKREGKTQEAAKLHELWNGKVGHYVNAKTRPNLFGSEFAFDSTGFESTGAMAHYAMDHASGPGQQGHYTAEQAKEFLEFQLRLNLGDRGWLENTYYQLGSDYRRKLTYLLSYMSQMGGWSVLDYGLYFAKDPADYLRLGYASSLSSWALVNSGTPESNYGFWWPGKENDGAAGGGFNPEPMGTGWIRKAVPRGAWYYSAEQDVGYCGALRTHATIVTKDPVFGEYAYGGELTRKLDAVSVIPRDGLRTRLHVVRDDQRLHMELIGDGFADGQPVTVNDKLTKIQFTLENRVKAAHKAQLCINGLADADYKFTVDGQSQTVRMPGDAADHWLELPVGSSPTAKVTIEKTALAEDASVEPYKQDLYTCGTKGYNAYRIPALVVTTKGTLLAFCEGRKDSIRDHGDIDLMLRRSADGGKTWSEQVIVHEEGGTAKITIGNPCPIVDQSTGTVWLAFCRDNRDVFMTHSDDDGISWVEPIEITASVKKKDWGWYATGPGHGIQLTRGKYKGRLVFPCDHGDAEEGRSHVFFSDDHGKTFVLGQATGGNMNECEVVELADGRLLLSMRNGLRKGLRAFSFSEDGGATWSEPGLNENIYCAVCQSSIHRYSWEPNILLYSGPGGPGRTNLTVRASYDEGKTWPAAKVVDFQGSGYSDLATLPDGSACCLLESGWYKPIVFTKFPLQWLIGESIK